MTTLDFPLLHLTADDLMSRELLVIPRHMSLRAAAHLLADARVSGAPVVDEEGRCVGVLSAADLVGWVDGAGPAPRGGATNEACVCCDWQLGGRDDTPPDAVCRHMTADAVTAPPSAPVGELARRMRDARIHRIVIADPDRRPVGVVSTMDILAAVARLEDAPGTEDA